MKAIRTFVAFLFVLLLGAVVSGCAVAPKKDLSIRANRDYVYVNGMQVCCNGEKNPHKIGTQAYKDHERVLDFLEGLIYVEKYVFNRNLDLTSELSLDLSSFSHISIYESRDKKGRVFVWNSLKYAFLFDKTVPPSFWAAMTANRPYFRAAPPAPFAQQCSDYYRTCRMILTEGIYPNKNPTLEDLCNIYDLDCEHPLHGIKLVKRKQ